MIATMSRNTNFPSGWPLFDDATRPSFKDPPVIEVVLSAQFVPLERMRVAHIGLLWGLYKEKFPELEDKPALNRVTENFGPPTPARGTFRVLTEPAPERSWFKTRDATEMLQVQRDRFIFNWRRFSWDEAYPRYPSVRSNFEDNFKKFAAFIKDNEIGIIEPDQCEVTYVNHIFEHEGVSARGRLKELLAYCSGEHSDAFLQEPEEAAIQLHYRINDENSQPLGRLHVQAHPQITTQDQRPLVRLTLTARGAPPIPSLEGILAFFDLGREYVVRGFASVTTERMHKIWGRE